MGRDPQTKEEWQEAANAAHCMLAIDAAVQFGLLVFKGPQINAERCAEILDRAQQIQIVPEPGIIERFVVDMKPKGRRGRKSMSEHERNEVSIRMKKYWSDRRNAHSEGGNA